ncbi:MAG: hypothetical protein IJT30_10410 [Muribaculaceae bacterium]|nr:hypothetical protein [Muribaculaceae bacterium]
MKKFLLILSLSVLLSSLFAGCVRRGAAEARLIAIDTLTATAPDSALSLLAATDTAALSEADRAYHALLTSQALYKAYIPATDSAAITAAGRWFDRHGPADRRVRAQLYRATTAEEMGNPVGAMRWYKRTELAARECGDDYRTGYALMSMGVLYQAVVQPTEAINKYRACLPLLAKCDSSLWLFSCLQLTQLYRRTNNDSVHHYSRLVTSHALDLGEPSYYYTAISTDAVIHFYKKRYSECIKSALPAVMRAPEYAPADLWYLLAGSYARLGNADSSRFYLAQSAAPGNVGDSILHLRALEALSELEGNIALSKQYSDSASNLSGATIVNNSKVNLRLVESAVEADAAQHSPAGGGELLGAAMLAILILFSAAAIPIRHWRKKRETKDISALRFMVNSLQIQKLQAENECTKLASDLHDSQARIEHLQTQLDTTLQTLGEQLNERGEADNVSKELETLRARYEEQAQMLMAKEIESQQLASSLGRMSDAILSMVESNAKLYKSGQLGSEGMRRIIFTDDFFNVLRQHINTTHHGLAEALAQAVGITDREVNVVCMHLCGFTNGLIKIYTGQTNNHSVTNLKDIIAKKFFGKNGAIGDFTNY